MKKVIIGFIGDHNSGRTTAADILKGKGFYKVSINKKVEEFFKYLFPQKDSNNSNSILNSIRRRGVNVNKEYWLNLVLVTVPDDKDLIVFDDLSIDEFETGKIIVYQIYRPGVSRVRLPYITTIENDGSLEEFTEKINQLYGKIAK
jgi:hypothetical protein